MLVLVADRLNEQALLEMRSMGVDVRYEPTLAAEDLPAALEGVGVLVVRGTRVGQAALERAEALNLIIRAGAGVRNIDVAEASTRGVYVAACPGRNASAVAELTMTLIGCLDRRVVDAAHSLREGRWEKNEYAQALGLRGRRIGIAGFGHVGRRVAALATAYGMQASAWSRRLTRTRAEEQGIGYAASLPELASQSDILSLHLDLTPRTAAIVDEKVLSELPSGAMLINTARAGLVDYDALVRAVDDKGLQVGLDVFPDEPPTRSGNYSHPILSRAAVYGTPHIGASTDEAQDAICTECVTILRSFLFESDVRNVVNIRGASPARYQLVIRHIDRLGVLANVLGVLKRNGINIQEVDNTVFEGGRAACAKIRVDTRPPDSCFAEIRAFDDEVLHVDLVTLPNLA